jgi:hypothetical protein
VNPSVAVDADGDFVVAWSGYIFHIPYGYHVIRGQRYDASGNTVGSAFQVNTTDITGGPFSEFPSASAAAEADGDFVVVWDSYEPGSFRDWDVQGQRYDASGNTVGSEFQLVIDEEGSFQGGPSVAADPNGGFVVAWHLSWRGGGYPQIMGEHYDANGNVVDSFQVNTYESGFSGSPAVAVDGNGDFVVVWSSDASAGDDPHWSVQGRRYSVPTLQVPSLRPPGVAGLALLLFGIAAAGLRGWLRERA